MSKSPEKRGGKQPTHYIESWFEKAKENDAKQATMYVGMAGTASRQDVLFRNFEELNHGLIWDRIILGIDVLDVDDSGKDRVFQRAYSNLKKEGRLEYRTRELEQAALENILSIAAKNRFNVLSVKEVENLSGITDIVWQKLDKPTQAET